MERKAEMHTKTKLLFSAHAFSAIAVTYVMKTVGGVDAAASALLILTLVSWWIAWKSIETLVGLGMAIVLYSICSGDKMPSILAVIILFGLSVAAGLFYWAPATLKKVQVNEK